MKSKQYQPKTGAKCGCKPGVERDNCPRCEGTGMVIDFACIRANTKRESAPVKGQHTPGPWKDHGATVYEVDKWKDGNNLGGQCVALCYQPMADEMPTEEQFANARLISAAPQLLEALRAMVAIHGPVATVSESVKALNQARAAISRAEGRVV